MSHETLTSVIDGVATFTIKHLGVEQLSLTYTDVDKTITLGPRAEYFRPKAEYLTNIAALQEWNSELNRQYMLPVIDTEPYLCSVSLSKDATKSKFTGTIGGITFGFEYKYATQEIKVSARLATEIVSWATWAFYFSLLIAFARIVADHS